MDIYVKYLTFDYVWLNFIFGWNNLFKRKINECPKDISLKKNLETFYGKKQFTFLVSLQLFIFLWY